MAMNKTRKLEIEIPAGKRAIWQNGVLTLVDSGDVTDRIKTFEDALKELGSTHPLVEEYLTISTRAITSDMLAYLKLRIIVAALNEGWQPQYSGDEIRWYPWFNLYTKEKYDELSKEDKSRCVLRSGNYSNANSGLACARAHYASSYSFTYCGGRLAFRSEELAVYAGRQFTEVYAEFYLFK